MSVPNTFASATSAIPLANLDADFAYYDAAFQIVGTAMEVNYTFRLEDPTDNTKKAEFVMSGITTGTTRQYTLPNATGTLATLANTSQTFTGSTVFAPSTNSGTVTIGATPQTGTITLGRSTVSQTVDIAVGATTAVSTKTINIGTTGVSGSTTNINLGSAVSGAVNNIVLNGSQVNSVPYLNTSRILTTGTGLRFDGYTLGIGVSPDSWDTTTYRAMQIAKSGAVYSSVSSNSISMSANTRYEQPDGFYYLYSGLASDYTQIDGTHTWSRAVSGTTNNVISFIPSMTLDASGNLGLGTTSPSVKLNTSTARAATVVSALFAETGTGVVSDVNKLTLSVQNTAGGATGGAGIGAVLEASASNKTGLAFYYDSGSGLQSEGMRLDSAGNLGLGVTPNTWTAYKALQIQGANGIYGFNPGDEFGSYQNAYYNAGWKYGVSSVAASRYAAYQGSHSWFTAPSGTAGNAITFTQAMTLNASGNLGIGTTSPAAKLHVSGTIRAGSTTDYVQLTQFNTNMWGWLCYPVGDYLIRLNTSTGNVGIRVDPDASAALDVQSTTKGVRMPNMTTTQKNAIASPAAGLMVFDTTLAKLCVYTGAAWQTVTSI